MLKLKDLLSFIQSLPISYDACLALAPFCDTADDQQQLFLYQQMDEGFPSYTDFQATYNEAAEYDNLIYGEQHELFPAKAELDEHLNKNEAQEASDPSRASKDSPFTDETGSFYPFRSTDSVPDDLYVALLLDAIMFAMDQSTFLRGEQGSPAILRALTNDFFAVTATAYDPELFPFQNSWVYNGVTEGDSYHSFTQSKDPTHGNLNPIGKEIEFLGVLLEKLKDTADKNTVESLTVSFLLYEMNKGSHALDATFSAYYHKNYSVYPQMFSTLYPFTRRLQDSKIVTEFYFASEYVCNLWASCLSQHLHISLHKRKDIVSLLNEMGQIHFIPLFFLKTNIASFLERHWRTVQEGMSLDGGSIDDYGYYRLMKNHSRNNRLTANSNGRLEKIANDLSSKIREGFPSKEGCLKEKAVASSSPTCSESQSADCFQCKRTFSKTELYSVDDHSKNVKVCKECRKKYYAICADCGGYFAKDDLGNGVCIACVGKPILEQCIQAEQSQKIEAEWKWSKNVSGGEMEPNWFGSSNLKFSGPAEEGGFGCPLRIFQKSIPEIEAVLGDAVILSASERLLINSDEDNQDCLDALDAESAKNRATLMDNIARLRENLSDVARGFYELFIQYELYPVLINMKTSDGRASANGLIPSQLAFSKDNPSEIVWKISPMAEKDGRLHFVYQQSPKRWLYIMETLCSISFGKDAPANSEEEFRRFKCKCGPNQRWRCRKTLAQLLEDQWDG